MGASLNVLGYRLAMILSGGIAFIWVDPAQGGGWTGPRCTASMALLMVGAAVVSALLLPRLAGRAEPSSVARNDVLGFLAVVAAVRVGFVVTRHVFAPGRAPLSRRCSAAGHRGGAAAAAGPTCSRCFAGIALTLPLAAWAARRARFETLLGGLASYFSQPGAAAFLAFIVLYKLGDAFAGSLLTPFLLQAMALQHGRGRRRQQGDRPVADDRRRPGRRRAHDPARPVARADAVRRPADGRATSASGGWR